MVRKNPNGQAVFAWFKAEPICAQPTIPNIRVGDDDVDPNAVRTRKQCAEILSAREHRTVTMSMVRTLEEKALDKLAAAMKESPLMRAILTAETPDEIAQTGEWLIDEGIR